jgi:hypothetical protein
MKTQHVPGTLEFIDTQDLLDELFARFPDSLFYYAEPKRGVTEGQELQCEIVAPMGFRELKTFARGVPRYIREIERRHRGKNRPH